MGWMKKPRLERGPKLNMPIAQPQAMMTNGVRQFGRPDPARTSLDAVDMRIPPRSGSIGAPARQD
jgi:hypothetical protein